MSGDNPKSEAVAITEWRDTLKHLRRAQAAAENAIREHPRGQEKYGRVLPKIKELIQDCEIISVL